MIGSFIEYGIYLFIRVLDEDLRWNVIESHFAEKRVCNLNFKVRNNSDM